MNDRIAVAIEEHNNKQTVAEHISRCSKFIVCELAEDKSLIKTEIYFNPLVGEPNGAYQLPDYLRQFNVNAIITGGMGQRAVNRFLKCRIAVLTAPGLTYEEVFNLYLKDKLRGYKSCRKHQKHLHN